MYNHRTNDEEYFFLILLMTKVEVVQILISGGKNFIKNALLFFVHALK